MDFQTLALLVFCALGGLLVLSFMLIKLLFRAARGGHVRARGALKVPGLSFEGELDARAEK